MWSACHGVPILCYALIICHPPSIYQQSSSGIDTYDSEPSLASFGEYPVDSASSEDGLMDSEDEPVDNNNMFIALGETKKRETKKPCSTLVSIGYYDDYRWIQLPKCVREAGKLFVYRYSI